MAALLLRLCLHGIFRVSGRHAAALCLRIYRAAGAICCRCLHYCFRLTVSKVSAHFYTSFFRFPTNFLPLFRSFVHFHHWHIGAYADFSLFFGAQLTFCLTVRLLFIELKRERQKNGNKKQMRRTNCEYVKI